MRSGKARHNHLLDFKTDDRAWPLVITKDRDFHDHWRIAAIGMLYPPQHGHPAAMHAVEFCRRSLLVDDSNAASPWTKLLDCIECAGVVSSINARLNDDHAIDMQCAMHVAQLVDRGGLRRVGASWSKRKALRIAKDVHVAIARAWRNFEVHRRSGLRSAGKGIGCRSKQRCCSSSGSGDEKVTSSWHRFQFYGDLGTVEEYEPSEPAQASWKPVLGVWHSRPRLWLCRR